MIPHRPFQVDAKVTVCKGGIAVAPWTETNGSDTSCCSLDTDCTANGFSCKVIPGQPLSAPEAATAAMAGGESTGLRKRGSSLSMKMPISFSVVEFSLGEKNGDGCAPGSVRGKKLAGLANYGLGKLVCRLRRQHFPPEAIWHLPWWLVVGAIGFSILISLAAGIYPASRAAQLDPVQTLRYE